MRAPSRAVPKLFWVDAASSLAIFVGLSKTKPVGTSLSKTPLSIPILSVKSPTFRKTNEAKRSYWQRRLVRSCISPFALIIHVPGPKARSLGTATLSIAATDSQNQHRANPQIVRWVLAVLHVQSCLEENCKDREDWIRRMQVQSVKLIARVRWTSR